MSCNEEWGAGTWHSQKSRDTSREGGIAGAAADFYEDEFDCTADIKTDIGAHYCVVNTA